MKRKLYTESLKQLLLPSAIALSCGLIMAVINVINANSPKTAHAGPSSIAEVLWHCCVLAYILPFIFIFYLFRFCYNKKYADLYHASAIKNRSAFFTLTAAALTMSFAIITVCYLFSIISFPNYLPAEAPLCMYLALLSANITLTAAALLGVSVSGKLFTGICFSLFVTFIPPLINYYVRNNGNSFLYDRNLITRLINYRLFENDVFVNEFIPPLTFILTLVCALVFFTLAYFAFVKRTAQTVGRDFVRPALRHLSATLLATPFLMHFLEALYNRSMNWHIYSSVDDFTMFIIFSVIFITYYTICTGNIKKIVGILIPLGISVALTLVIFAVYKSIPATPSVKKYELPPKNTVLTNQYNDSRFTVCDDDMIDSLYEEFEKLSYYEKRMAFEYEWIDDLVIIYSKSFTGGKSYVLTLTPESFPETYSILKSKNKE